MDAMAVGRMLAVLAYCCLRSSQIATHIRLTPGLELARH
jgi:hypothetical protein